MSLLKYEKTDANKYSLEISVSSDLFLKEISNIYKKKSKDINVPGFRRGKAPKSIIEKMYGENIFWEDAVNNLYPEAYYEAAKEANLKIVDTTSLDVISISKENGFIFKINCVCEPEVKVGEYKGLSATKKISAITDKDVEDEIDKIKNNYSRTIEIDNRPAKIDDEVLIDFEGFIDGIPFKGGKGDGYKLKLGSGQFIPGFEDQIVGHNINDTFDVNVTFPEDYNSKDFAGKDAIFKVTIHNITSIELPEVDDEFVKDISDFDTIADFKQDIIQKIQLNKDAISEQAVENELIDNIINNMTVDIPKIMIDKKTDEMFSNFANNLKQQGLDMSVYLKYINTTEEDFKKQFENEAERNVKLRLALKKIAEIESIKISPEELDKRIEDLAKSYKVTTDKIKSVFDIDIIEEDIAIEKAIKIIKDTAKITQEKAN